MSIHSAINSGRRYTVMFKNKEHEGFYMNCLRKCKCQDVYHKDSDELFLVDELRSIMRKLAVAGSSIEYLFRPVKETGFLHRDEAGEFVTGQGYSYRCGSLIEVLLRDGSGEVPWATGHWWK